jgi:hypothetical protein
MSTRENDFAHVKALGKSNFEIEAGDSDIRGWTVKNEQGNILGEVDDLLFDTHARRVLYIVLDMDGNELNLKDRKVLVPIEVADLHEGYKNVILPGVMANELAAIPTNEKGCLSTKTVDLITHTFSNINSRNRQNTYNQDHGHASHDSQTLSSPPQAAALNSDRSSSSMQSAAPAEAHTSQDTVKHVHKSDSGTDHHSDHKTVVGVYDHTNQAQAAIDYLVKNGFNRDHIVVTSRENDSDEAGISGFFHSLFKNSNDADKYSHAARTGAVVTVDVHSDKEAEEAAEILDQLGAVNMDDRNDIARKYRSVILIRNSGYLAT